MENSIKHNIFISALLKANKFGAIIETERYAALKYWDNIIYIK